MALAARSTAEYQPGNLKISAVVESGTVIFDGALVGVFKPTGGGADGYATNWSDGTDQMYFAGIAVITDQNSSTGTGDKVTGDGTVEIEIDISGVIIKNATVAGLDNQNDVLDLVYGSDSNTLSLTAETGSNEIGVVTRYSGTSGTGDVHLYSMMQFLSHLVTPS